jgi:cell volume regulation protein A
MFLVDQLILLGGIFLLIGIVSSKFSARLGLPVLVLFLAVGMAAGEDGIGGIQFDNFRLAHAIGTLALGIILFDGGLQTRRSSLRAAWKPAALLATVGVLVTAAITGIAASLLAGIPILTGLLLGSIVASTDAAAVFAVLRSQGVRLRERLSATLEIESGSNDPMAIFLTIGLLEVLTGGAELGLGLVGLFAQQMGLGALVGLAGGWLTVRLVNRINLAAPGLYPVLAGACGLLVFGVAAVVGGSGFLAIYLAGIVLGNSRLVFQRGTFLFMDGLAWVGQITMFVALGLLSTPSELVGVAPQGLLVSAALILVARPLAVVPLLAPFGYSVREHVLIAWVGLKGAVPIVLATFPLMYGLPEAPLLFNLIFFVVLVSATLQGWTLPILATRLGLQEPEVPRSPASLELTALRDVNAEVVDYTLTAASPIAGRSLSELQLPEGALVAMISRGSSLVPARGATVLRPGDHVFVLLRQDSRDEVDRVFGHA